MQAQHSLNYYYSNRTELLADKLLENLDTFRTEDCFKKDIVVVQGKGMERYLSQKIAKDRGICMNIEFPFPQKIFREIFLELFPEIQTGKWVIPTNNEVSWRLYTHLEEWMEMNPEHYTAVQHYLRNDPNQLKKFQLCNRVANLFDQYAAYRPEELKMWSLGKIGSFDESYQWQFMLWNHVFNEPSSNTAQWKSIAQLLLELAKRPERLRNLKGIKNSPLHFFGISTLPELYTRLLEELQRLVSIHIYLPYACEEPPLEDGRTLKRMLYYQLRDQIKNEDHEDSSSTPSADTTFMTEGNSLALDMGEQAGVFMNRLIQGNWTEFGIFSPQDSTDHQHSLLQSLQLQMESFEAPDAKIQKKADSSIQLHSCYSPYREAEAVRDFLIRSFHKAHQDNQPLTPSDIIIMVPDIEKYGPCIHAVFSNNQSLYIPFSVADQSVRNENEYAKFILQILELRKGRFSAEEVLALFDYDIIRNKLSLEEDDITKIRDIVAKSGFRWGRNEAHCKHFVEKADLTYHNWAFARKRIMYGMLMMTEDWTLYNEALPLQQKTEDDTLAASVVSFIDQVVEILNNLENYHTIEDWVEFVVHTRDRILPQQNINSDDLGIINHVITQLNQLRDYGLTDIPEAVFHEYLRNTFDEINVGKGFLTGKVTVCEMRPMRSIPAKIVCLIGLNDGDFPRLENKMSFDAIAQHPKPGDRSQTLEDRNLFLESVMAAREKLYISWTGKSIRDNSERPPSVLLSDFMDHIDNTFESHENTPISKQLIIEETLHAFDPSNFSTEKTVEQRSLSTQDYETAQHLGQQKISPLIDSEIPPTAQSQNILLDDFIRFFQNPSLYFHKQVLSAQLISPADVQIKNELLFLDALNNYKLRNELIQPDKSHSAEKQKAFIQEDLIPAGIEGTAILNKSEKEIRTFLEKCQEAWGTTTPERSQFFTYTHGNCTISSRLYLYNDTNCVSRIAKQKTKDLLGAWIQHLFYIATQESIHPESSTIAIYLDKQTTLDLIEPEVAKAHLAELIDLYQQGLRSPIPFFIESAHAFAKSTYSDKGDPIEQALKQWIDTGIDTSTNESATYPIPEFFDTTEIIQSEAFASIAQRVFLPIFQNIK